MKEEFLTNLRDIITIVTFLGLFVEFTPIPVHPLRWVGRQFNKDVMDRLDDIDKRLTAVEKDKTKNKRTTIIDFANALKHGRTQSPNAFKNIFKTIDDYNKEIEELGIQNGYIEVEAEYIKKAYHECCINGTLLMFDDNVFLEEDKKGE